MICRHFEKLCARSFIDNGHEFHLYIYGDVGGIPEGVTVKDGNEILPEKHIFQDKSITYGTFADWFRYALLLKKGGCWVDMDMVCIKPFDFDSEIFFGSTLDYYLNCVFGLPAGHPLAAAMEKRCREYPNKKNASWTQVAGPIVFTKYIRQFGLEKYVKPSVYFSPWCWLNWGVAFDRTFCEGIHLHPNTYAVHLYNEMGRHVKLNKNAEV